eukprot:TRINITY_DN3708_c0_g2_i1.p1 TRINITY_DN3708_c0_g2~~TRINITY_DN3708_c0_g2_i1.p1  ORF type:complete len:232 (-),score=51.90 TRINITY_DN3708_c0_g2_i1:118-813(-)
MNVLEVEIDKLKAKIYGFRNERGEIVRLSGLEDKLAELEEKLTEKDSEWQTKYFPLKFELEDVEDPTKQKDISRKLQKMGYKSYYDTQIQLDNVQNELNIAYDSLRNLRKMRPVVTDEATIKVLQKKVKHTKRKFKKFCKRNSEGKEVEKARLERNVAFAKKELSQAQLEYKFAKAEPPLKRLRILPSHGNLLRITDIVPKDQFTSPFSNKTYMIRKCFEEYYNDIVSSKN